MAKTRTSLSCHAVPDYTGTGARPGRVMRTRGAVDSVGAAVFRPRVGLPRLPVSKGLGASSRNKARQLPLTRMLRRPAKSPRSGCSRYSGRSRSANVRRKRYARASGPPRAESECQEDEARSREDRTGSGGLMGTNMAAGNR